jgi:hypothetical protein
MDVEPALAGLHLRKELVVFVVLVVHAGILEACRPASASARPSACSRRSASR